ncbi:MAG: acetate--CoA ligase family protein [SAR324 cluster bacterium]|nr:acetate--CoA ligase family protein [SAR324 cluster bacterium]
MTEGRSAFDALFHPRSISVIGASSNTAKLGGRTFRNLKDLGFQGSLYPIHNRDQEVQGIPAVPSVGDLPDDVDMAFILVPAPSVVQALEEYAAKGVRSAVVFSSGFAEVSEEGRASQERITALARETGMRIVGPNCMGVMNVHEGMLGTFTSSFDYGLPSPGRISVVSQSGAFGAHCFVLARERGLGLNLWATTGNECDVDVADCLGYMAQDPQTDVILCYMEGCKSKERLVGALEIALQRNKPVVMLKVGRTEVGAEAASSHTASLVGSDAVYDAIFKQYGVHRAETIEELTDICYACVAGRFPPGKRVGLVTISGGVGVVMADAASQAGLEVPPMPDETQKKLKELLPFAAVRNPIDFTAQALTDTALVRQNLEIMLDEGGCDAVVLFLASVGLNPRLMGQLTDSLLELRKQFGQELIVMSILVRDELKKTLEDAGFLLFEDPTRAIKAVAALMKFGEAFRNAGKKQPPPALPEGGLPFPTSTVGEYEAKRVLAAAGIPVVEERLAQSAEQAVAAAGELGYPVVLKIASPDIPHKSEIGGVVLNLDSAEAVAQAHAQLLERAREHQPDARIDGILVAAMVSGGVETILGVSRDPVFGPVVLFGLGGIFVEVMKDVTFRLAPFSVEEAHRMIREVRGYPLLEGVRGQPPADVEALAQALAQLSAFAAAHQERLETLDLNPFIVLPEGQGALAVDALIVPRED